MPQRKVLQTVIVFRDGQRVAPAIGSIFNFTDDEYRQIQSLNPDALGKPVASVNVEDGGRFYTEADIAKIRQEAADAAAAGTKAKKPTKAEIEAAKAQEEADAAKAQEEADAAAAAKAAAEEV